MEIRSTNEHRHARDADRRLETSTAVRIFRFNPIFLAFFIFSFSAAIIVYGIWSLTESYMYHSQVVIGSIICLFFFIPPLNYPVWFIADLLTGYLAVLPSLILVYYIIHTCTLHISSLSPLSMTGTSALNDLNRSALYRDVTVDRWKFRSLFDGLFPRV